MLTMHGKEAGFEISVGFMDMGIHFALVRESHLTRKKLKVLHCIQVFHIRVSNIAIDLQTNF